ncbi:hypothetical protein SAMN04244553_5512 [Nocardia amikacinitolerans]|uniref:Uncharacterized protein n=1 Tax=Nocardia amikacinitolerans TaxID=756689 RepID=A0A285LVN8_9NOCA|nr:hypothetical protein [Nocardia amikacinitolerans]MCP2280692.1 hypothetical protein [Nocardia amikacinitolerans]MCP2316994.1 hypothetical protein [Nocardia amikacinitolerans]SNY88533.1 hypothetical protein SAMN04244553_5512 [Nocardia amikacinitolerans]
MSTVTVALLLGFVCCALVIRGFALRGEAVRPRRVSVGGRRVRPRDAAWTVDA